MSERGNKCWGLRGTHTSNRAGGSGKSGSAALPSPSLCAALNASTQSASASASAAGGASRLEPHLKPAQQEPAEEECTVAQPHLHRRGEREIPLINLCLQKDKSGGTCTSRETDMQANMGWCMWAKVGGGNGGANTTQ